MSQSFYYLFANAIYSIFLSLRANPTMQHVFEKYRREVDAVVKRRYVRIVFR